MQLRQELVTCAAQYHVRGCAGKPVWQEACSCHAWSSTRSPWARLRLHIHGWVVLRLPALSKTGLIFCCQTPEGGSLRAHGAISGISGQSGDRQLGGQGVSYHASCPGVSSASALEAFWPFEAKVQLTLPWWRSKPKTAALAQAQQRKA